MSRVATRLARIRAAIPPPPPTAPAYDLSRLTAAQLWRMGQLRGRVDAVGLAGLADEEVDELAAMSEVLLAPDPTDPPGEDSK